MSPGLESRSVVEPDELGALHVWVAGSPLLASGSPRR